MRVIAEAGAPISGVRVHVSLADGGPFKRWLPRGWPLAPGPDGCVAPFGIAPLGYCVRAAAPGFEDGALEIERGRGDVEETICLRRAESPRARLRVRLRPGTAGLPPGSGRCVVTVVELGPAEQSVFGGPPAVASTRVEQRTMDAEGEATFSSCRLGVAHTVLAEVRTATLASRASGRMVVAEHVRIEGDERIVEWTPRPLRSVRFRCPDEHGQGAGGLTISIRRHTAEESDLPAHAARYDNLDLADVGEFRTNQEGAALAWLEDGTYGVEIRGGGAHAEREALCFSVAGRDETVVVPVRTGVTLRGTLRLGDGRPVAGREVSASTSKRIRSGRTDRDGAWEIRGLEPGECRVAAEGLQGEPDAVVVSEVQAPASGVDLVLRTAQMIGRVTSAAPRRFRVFLTPMSGRYLEHSVEVWTGADGRFVVDDLAEGGWRILAVDTRGERGAEWSGRVTGDTLVELQAP